MLDNHNFVTVTTDHEFLERLGRTYGSTTKTLIIFLSRTSERKVTERDHRRYLQANFERRGVRVLAHSADIKHA